MTRKCHNCMHLKVIHMTVHYISSDANLVAFCKIHTKISALKSH